jgi:hypothetical protein
VNDDQFHESSFNLDLDLNQWPNVEGKTSKYDIHLCIKLKWPLVWHNHLLPSLDICTLVIYLEFQPTIHSSFKVFYEGKYENDDVHLFAQT